MTLSTDLTSITLATLGTWLVWEMLYTAMRRAPDWVHTLLAAGVALLLLSAPWPAIRYGLGVAGAVAVIRIALTKATRR